MKKTNYYLTMTKATLILSMSGFLVVGFIYLLGQSMPHNADKQFGTPTVFYVFWTLIILSLIAYIWIRVILFKEKEIPIFIKVFAVILMIATIVGPIGLLVDYLYDAVKSRKH